MYCSLLLKLKWSHASHPTALWLKVGFKNRRFLNFLTQIRTITVSSNINEVFEWSVRWCVFWQRLIKGQSYFVVSGGTGL